MALSMNVEERNFFKKFNGNFAIVILALNIVGLINLYSATHGVNMGSTTHLFKQQLIWLSGGWILFFIVTLVDYKILTRLSWFLYVANLLAILAVRFVGKSFYGAQRWLDLGFFRYQPTETMKLILVLVLAQILMKKSRHEGLGLKDLLFPLFITILPFILTVKQPDLGTALLLLAIFFSMLLFVRVKTSLIIVSLLIGIVTTPIVWNFGLKPYQKDRVLTFLDPGRDPRGKGYNSIQSKIAVGSGLFFGKGFRKGTQSQLEFLPERHTDFIFSVLSEEFGFIGSTTTFGLFIVLYIMMLRIAMQSKDKYGALITVGALAYLFWHVSVNIGMVIGLLPIVGVPLPLLSYGGSSLLTTMFGLGLVSSVSYRKYFF